MKLNQSIITRLIQNLSNLKLVNDLFFEVMYTLKQDSSFHLHFHHSLLISDEAIAVTMKVLKFSSTKFLSLFVKLRIIQDYKTMNQNHSSHLYIL